MKNPAILMNRCTNTKKENMTENCETAEQFEMGKSYFLGDNVPLDYEKAVYYFAFYNIRKFLNNINIALV
jgi:hypothetical protein